MFIAGSGILTLLFFKSFFALFFVFPVFFFHFYNQYNFKTSSGVYGISPLGARARSTSAFITQTNVFLFLHLSVYAVVSRSRRCVSFIFVALVLTFFPPVFFFTFLHSLSLSKTSIPMSSNGETFFISPLSPFTNHIKRHVLFFWNTRPIIIFVLCPQWPKRNISENFVSAKPSEFFLIALFSIRLPIIIPYRLYIHYNFAKISLISGCVSVCWCVCVCVSASARVYICVCVVCAYVDAHDRNIFFSACTLSCQTRIYICIYFYMCIYIYIIY